MDKITKPKKSVGRPRKAPPANAVLMKSKTEIALEHANIKIQALDEIIQDLEKRLDLSYREQEDMLKELDRNIDMMKYHCEQVAINTGEITLGDIYYCANMINRIMEHKFGYKPKMQEL